MDKNEFQEKLVSKTKELDQIISSFLPKEEGPQKKVIEAMNYSIMAGGKRLRPMLMWETFRMCGGEGDVIRPFLAAIEMIHTYSLVHDDLPAMDNDAYRRGRRTTWYVYGDAFGILAGDGLLNLAFETALQAFGPGTAEMGVAGPGKTQAVDPGRIARAISVLAAKAGIHGMIGGQTADILAENGDGSLTKEQLLFIHENKTAALIQAAMTIGAILAGAGEEQVQLLEKCAYNIGIAFQIQDDILDVTGSLEELGKPIGSDAASNKQTYVTLEGLKKAKEDVERLSEEAVKLLDSFAAGHEFLRELILMLIHRCR